MRARLLMLAAGLSAGIALLAAATVPLAGQAGGVPAKKPAAGAIPRMADGHPDLQGTYDLATLTPMERRAGTPLVLTNEEAAKLEKAVAQGKDQGLAPIKGDRSAPPAG